MSSTWLVQYTRNNVAHMPIYHVVAGMEALWGAANVSCPMNAGTGQCSYTPQPISLELNVWKEFTFSAEAKFGESHNYHLGRSGPAPSSVYTQYGAETAVNCFFHFCFSTQSQTPPDILALPGWYLLSCWSQAWRGLTTCTLESRQSTYSARAIHFDECSDTYNQFDELVKRCFFCI